MTDDQPRQFSPGMRERLLHERIVVLDGVLDDDNGTLIATQMLTLAAADPKADIALWIHSPGGSVPAMLAIRDVMRLVPCDVGTLALGMACRRRRGRAASGRGWRASPVEVEVQANDLRHM